MYRYRNYNFNPTYRNVKQPYLNSHKPPTVSNPGRPMPPPLPPPPVCHKPPPPPPKPPALISICIFVYAPYRIKTNLFSP